MERASDVDKGRTDDRNVDFPQSGSPSNSIDISRGSAIVKYIYISLTFSSHSEEKDRKKEDNDIKRKYSFLIVIGHHVHFGVRFKF